MARIERHVCDGKCGKEVENVHAAPGWISIGGAVSRHWGLYGVSSYMTDYVTYDSGNSCLEFCSIECLVRALDAKRDAIIGETGKRPPYMSPTVKGTQAEEGRSPTVHERIVRED